jgi:hypothetical protein
VKRDGQDLAASSGVTNSKDGMEVSMEEKVQAYWCEEAILRTPRDISPDPLFTLLETFYIVSDEVTREQHSLLSRERVQL